VLLLLLVVLLVLLCVVVVVVDVVAVVVGVVAVVVVAFGCHPIESPCVTARAASLTVRFLRCTAAGPRAATVEESQLCFCLLCHLLSGARTM
jgi:hypothetical protein